MLVASKLVTQTPIPVHLSVGLLLSDEVVNGVVGHNDHDVVAFGNLDILPAENVAIGVEYKQGVDAGDGIRNHDYWDAHVVWFVTKNLTVVAAFAETGDKDRTSSSARTPRAGRCSGAATSRTSCSTDRRSPPPPSSCLQYTIPIGMPLGMPRRGATRCGEVAPLPVRANRHFMLSAMALYSASG